jgi:hypothetical protein
MKKFNLILVLCLLTVLTFGQLTVSVPTITAMPGQTVLIPVKLSGASSSGIPISSANIHITYDTAVLSYVNTTNFYSAMPSSQWYYSGNFNSDPSCNSYTASANWVHSSLGVQPVPDGTTLYEIQFLYKGGNASLNFCIYEFTDVNYDFIQTTPVNGSVNAPTLTGPGLVCGEGSTGNVYTTDPGMTNYQWTVTGGTITSGGGSGDNTVTVTWPTTGNHQISVVYNSNISASKQVSVYSISPVSLSVTASQNSVCAGTSVTFTATPTNGGSNPIYQWKKNGANVGTNSPVYTYTPANNDVITCVLTSDATCVSGNPATSNAITMTVTTNVNVSVSIAASANPVTAGTQVTFTATPVNGGPTPVYQWKVNGVNVGSNSGNYSFIPVNGDQVFCLLTSSITCVNNPVATSNVITMTVNTLPVTPLIVTLPNKLVIPGTTVIFPVKLKGANVNGTPISSANIQIAYDPAVLDYDTLINFYSAMPASQWFYSGNNNTVSANWIEPSLLTLAVPDSTTLFEIRFTYIGGTGQLPFVTYEFTNAAFDFIPTTPYNGSIAPPFAQTGYIAGDFHQHTTYTDGSYSFAHVMAKNNQYNLDWWANSEHGGGFNRDGEVSGTDLGTTVYWNSYSPNPIVGTVSSSSGHQNMWRWQSLRDYSFENVLSARSAYPNRMIFQGYEFNVPGHEHASMGLINNQFLANPNCNPLAEFEFKFDNSDADMIGGVAQGWTKSVLSGHAKAVEAITWLQTNYPNTSYVIAAHPERKNLNNIAGFRDMNNAGPDVCFGFESMPGHQRGPDRGEYKASNGTVGTFTYGGCGIYAGKVGGLWDAMLSEGRSWWLFASSDFHNLTADFYPGEYQKTYTYVNNRYNPQSYVDGLRSGNSYIVNGDLIDSLQFRIGESAAMPLYASMGETFVNTDGSVVIKIKVRDPQTPNNNTFSSYTNPELNHIDLIMGKVHGLVAPGSANYSVDTVATTGVIARFDATGGVSSPNGIVSQAWTDLGNGWKEINYAYNGLTDTAYFRLRGTNLGLGVQNETDANGNPLSDGLMSPNSPEKAYADLWFYSNPIFVNGPAAPTISGPTDVCDGSTGNTYITEAGKTNYVWSVNGGTITSGGTATDNSVTVTWTTTGSQSVAVSYSGSITTTLPVNVNALNPVGVTISASENPVCSGVPVTFTATPVSGGSNPVYQWKKNGTSVGTNNATYTYTPANNDVVTCLLTSDVACASGNPAVSNAITMTVTAKVNVSVSISASQNPVVPGTSVTFTATPVNGGPTPVYQWKVNGLNAGTNAPVFSYVPSNGDQIFCTLTTSLTCYNNQIGTSNVITMTVSASGQLLVTLPNITAMPGEVLYFPVKLKGASSTGTPVSSANIQISYDPAVLHYDTLVNFHASMPGSQWFYSGNNNTVSANWMEPSLQTLAIPDSTTLFEVKFTYLGGNGTLPFVVKEFTDATFEFIPTTGVNGGVSQRVPDNVSVQNVSVVSGQDTCFNAIQQLTVAGSGTIFQVMNGGSATLIAGQKISMLPGVTVSAGGYLHAHITLNGTYCDQLPNPVVNPPASPQEITSTESTGKGLNGLKLYPNPTTGAFTISFDGSQEGRMVEARIYTVSGEEVYSEKLNYVSSQEFSIQGFLPGMYFIRIKTTEGTDILKVVKL